MAMAYSDTDVAFAPRAEHTSMPRFSHSATSMLSRPTPSRPTTFSLGAISSSAFVYRRAVAHDQARQVAHELFQLAALVPQLLS